MKSLIFGESTSENPLTTYRLWRKSGQRLYNSGMDDAAATTGRAPASGGSNSGLHILVLDPLFQRADQPATTRTYDFARRFVEAGHRVTVLTTTAGLGGSDGHTQLIDGLTVIAVPTALRVQFGYDPPPALMGAFARTVAWRIWRIAEVDAVIAVDRPAEMLPLIGLFCLVRGVLPLIVWTHAPDNRPARRRARYMTRVAAAMARMAHRLGMASARRIVALTREVGDSLTTRRMDASKVVVSGGGCDVALFAATAGNDGLAGRLRAAEGPLVVHAGVMTKDSKLDALIDIAALLQTSIPDLAFAFCGDGPWRARLEAHAADREVLDKTVVFFDPLPRRDLPGLLTRANVIVADGTSGDFYDGLAAGKPMALLSPGWQLELIEGRGAGIGLAADPTTAARELADFMHDADGLRRAGQQAAALAAGRFALERIITEIKNVVEEAVAAKPRATVMRQRNLRAKRFIDVVVSLAALIVLSPVLLIIAITVAAKMGWPILFTQERPGFKGKLFRIYKFRTMTAVRDAGGATLSDGERLTPLGQFLRRSSLDELPELFNVLIGDMSLVGPRPLLPEYLPYYTAAQRRRHDMRPGITGWSQVNGRNTLTWEDKFALDVWYVDHFSEWLDIKIAFKTIWVLLAGKGVSAPGHATMPRFDEIMAHRQGAEDT